MNRSKFIEKYTLFIQLATALSEKARREGLLSMESEIEDIDQGDEGEIFKQGLRLVVDGIDSTIIDEILSNKAAHEKDKYMRMYKTILKRAVLGIQAGLNTKILFHILNSYAGLSQKEESNIMSELLKNDSDNRNDNDSSSSSSDDLDLEG